MSKNIIIQKNGVDQTLTGTEQIYTNDMENGTIHWVPEDELVLSELNVTQPGTYTPGAGIYGFSVVTATLQAESVTGTIDGVTYVVTVDSSGNLVYTPQS